MKEQEHKREIEKLWSDKLTAYRTQREQEWEQKRQEQQQEKIYQEAVTEYKNQLLAEHAALLSEYNPKAAS
jgi:predicted S18 family serine protease